MFKQKDESEEYLAAFEAGKKLHYGNMEPGAVEIELLVDQRRGREVVETVMPNPTVQRAHFVCR